MKHLLLLSALIISAPPLSAQLTVKPTASNEDSFVYVNDEIVYVEGEINLTRNGSANNREASIYLRNDGQLIQGGTTSANSGNGQLSVQQNSPVTNAYAYYSWCSPVGNSDGNSGSGNIPFGLGAMYEDQNALPGIGTNARRVSTTPSWNGFVGPSAAPLTVSTRWMYVLTTPGTEAEANYTRIYAGNGAPAGFGFTMKGVNLDNVDPTSSPWGDDQIYEFRGRPNNGDFNIPVLGTTLSGEAQMTLTGNPYPSALDLNKLFYDTGNGALSAIFYYDEDRSVMSHYYSQKPYGYGVWTPGGPDDTPNDPNDFPGNYVQATFYIWNAAGTQTGPGSGTPSNDQNKRFAPIGQGFMFVGNNSTQADVYIRNSQRVYIKEGAANQSVFFRPTGGNENDTLEENNLSGSVNSEISALPEPDYRSPQMRLWTIFDEALTRDMLLVFSDQATDGYDRGFDGISPLGMKNDAYFPIGEDSNRLPYVINGTNYDENKQIPITFTLKNQIKFEVKAVEEIKKPYTTAYLLDRQTGNLQQISGGRSATYNLPAGKYEDRFFIIFKKPNLRPGNPDNLLEAEVTSNVGFFQNNPVKQLEIQNPEGYSIRSVAMYDMSGKLVLSKNNLGDSHTLSFYTGNLSNGVYLVKLTTADDITIDYKAVVHN